MKGTQYTVTTINIVSLKEKPYKPQEKVILKENPKSSWVRECREPSDSLTLGFPLRLLFLLDLQGFFFQWNNIVMVVFIYWLPFKLKHGLF